MSIDTFTDVLLYREDGFHGFRIHMDHYKDTQTLEQTHRQRLQGLTIPFTITTEL